MSNYSFWEHLSKDNRDKLKDYQDEHFKTKLDIAIMPAPPVTLKPSWPTSEECEKHMKQRPHKMKRVA